MPHHLQLIQHHITINTEIQHCQHVTITHMKQFNVTSSIYAVCTHIKM